MGVELQKQPGSQPEGEAAGLSEGLGRVEGWRYRAGVEGCRSGAGVEGAAGCEVVSEVDGASLLSVWLEQQTDVLVLEWCCLVHAGQTDNSSALKVKRRR